MTFTTNVKNELCTLETRPIEILSELSAIIRNSYKDQTIIKIITENILVAERIYRLINLEYNISPQIIVRKGYNYNKNYLYILEIKEVDMICRDLNIEEVPKEYLVADEEQIKAYLRGLFLIKGSVNDPQKSRYHLELSVDKEDYARFVLKILSQYNINAKVINMHTIKPLDTEAVKKCYNARLIVTVEEHSKIGGLGSAVAEVLAQDKEKPQQLIIGIDDMYQKAGEYGYLLEQYGLKPEQIAEQILNTYKGESK